MDKKSKQTNSQSQKGFFSSILHFLHPNKTIQKTDNEVVKLQCTIPTEDLFQLYLDYYLTNKESTIRQRAAAFKITKYRSEILTKEIKQRFSENETVL